MLDLLCSPASQSNRQSDSECIMLGVRLGAWGGSTAALQEERQHHHLGKDKGGEVEAERRGLESEGRLQRCEEGIKCLIRKRFSAGGRTAEGDECPEMVIVFCFVVVAPQVVWKRGEWGRER